MRVASAVFLAMFLSTAGICQISVPVRFADDSTQLQHVDGMIERGVLYVSLDDLARGLGARLSRAADRIEVRNGSSALRLIEDNPFIVSSSDGITSNVVQLPFAVTGSGGEIFVPVESFIPLIDAIFEEEIRFDFEEITVGAGTIGERVRPLEQQPVKSGFDLTGMVFEERDNGYLFRVKASSPVEEFDSWLKIDGDRTWLYITIANVTADVATIESTPKSDVLEKVLVFQSETSVQITARLNGYFRNKEASVVPGGNDLLISLFSELPEIIDTVVAIDSGNTLDLERERWKLDCIVIDAGHGGDDPGTIGVDRTKEKDVTLSVALKLGKLISEQLPDVKVVYTREKDEFIELYKRGQIANQAGGKLFVSIHCNSAPRKPHPINGFEIYLLRPGKTDHAIKIAERENAVVQLEEGTAHRYQNLTDDRFILLTMAQSAYAKFSEQFAGLLQEEMASHLTLRNNGVRQAGFYVLVGASMPNVLVETGYLSNTQEERFLRSAKGQIRIAESIFNGIKKYKEEYEKALGEGVAVGNEE